jgi:CheY-like chemotaxis protein
MMGHVQTPKATKSHPVHTAGQEQLTAEMAKDLHDTIRRSVISPVIEAAAPAIQKTIPRSTSLLLVDDEKNALENAHKALTGSALPHANHGDSPLTVSLVTWPRGKREVATNFKDLVNRCTSLIKAELKPPNQAQDVVVITDVLFELANSTQTGIDLIKELRDAFENQLGIVVFTGFKTPFVAMSAYLNGADYVVEKGGYGGSHETLQMSGNDRLLEALSFLCFQRAYLRNMRSSCESLITGNANEKMPDNNAIGQRIRQFVRTMPQGTVSLHLQKEWADTFYLLKRIQIQSAPSDSELRAIFKDMQEKYDHA